MRRHAVNLIVRSHDADGSAFIERFFESKKESLAKHTLRDIDRRAVHARFRLAVRRKMFQRCDDALFIAERSVALKSAHSRDAQTRNQIRVFAVGLLDAAPARVARHIHHRRQRLMRSAQSRFFGSHREKRFDQIGIERRSERYGLRKTCGVNRRVAVQTFFVKDHRDSETAVLDEELLNRVSEFSHLSSVLAFSRIAWASNLTEPVPMFESGFGFMKVEVAVGVHERFCFLLPDAHHLRGFFFERHPRQQIFHTSRRRQIGIFVR